MEQEKQLNWRELGGAILRGAGLGLLIGAAFVGGYLYREHTGLEPSDTSYALLNEAESILQDDFLFDFPDNEARVYAALSGMVGSLDDPYTYFVEPRSAEVDEQNLAGRFGGIGAELSRNETGEYVIVNVYRDNPAYEAGLEAGDIIRAVDSMPVTPELEMNDVLAAIRGEVGEPVVLTVERNEETLEKEIVRAEVLIPSTFWRILEDRPNVGYIQITRFTHRSPEEVREALDELSELGAEAYVLDLRNNGGGLVDSAVDVMDEFLSGGLLLLEERADGSERTFRAAPGGKAVDIPLVILINDGTASAAEIVAGALRDRERAALVGQQTFGKGTVQVLRDLSDGSTLHITTAQWFTPGGIRIEGEGLNPDIEVTPSEDEDAELAAALEYLDQNDVVSADANSTDD